MTDPAQRMSLQQMRNHAWLRQAYESSVATSAPSACSAVADGRQDTGQGSSACSFVPSNVLTASDVNNRQAAKPEEVNTSTETVNNVTTSVFKPSAPGNAAAENAQVAPIIKCLNVVDSDSSLDQANQENHK